MYLISNLFVDVMSNQSYLLVKLEFEENNCDLDTSLEYITNNICGSLKAVFGEVGASIPFTVIKYCPETSSAIIECPDTCLVKLRTALSLQNSYQGINLTKLPLLDFVLEYIVLSGVECCFTVSQIAKDLICLSV